MLERIAELKRAAQDELAHEKAAFTNTVTTRSYTHAFQFSGIEGIVVCELICFQLDEIQGETDDVVAQSIENYRKRVTHKLISDNPPNEVEVLRYKAMRYVLDRLRYM
jgi:hypothetical protein